MRVLAMIGLIVMLRWWPLAAFIIAVAWFAIWLARERGRQATNARLKERAALIARADRQQAWRLVDDPRGWYRKLLTRANVIAGSSRATAMVHSQIHS